MMSLDIYKISGMTCQACVKRVQAALAPFAEKVEVSLLPSQATLQNAKVDIGRLATALAGTRYCINEIVHSTPVTPIVMLPIKQVAITNAADVQSSLNWFVTYRPLLLILAYLCAASVLIQIPINGLEGVHWHETMRYFMAGFFLVFSFFKLLDVPAFADAYAGYDLLAKHWHGWGLIYPFVELALGIAYLANWSPLLTNWVTLIIMGFSAIGVIQAVLDKRSIRCACLGAVFKLPMSTVTIIEDVGMVAMAALTIWQVSLVSQCLIIDSS
jgi:copper chaperone CopZ